MSPLHLNTAGPISELIAQHGIAWPARAPSYESLIVQLTRISNAVSPAGEWASGIETGFSEDDCARRSANQRKVLSQVLTALECGVRDWAERAQQPFPANRLVRRLLSRSERASERDDDAHDPRLPQPQTATVLLDIVEMLVLRQRGAQGLADSVLFHLGGPDISERTARRYGTTRRAWLARQEGLV
ncbi:uncharacterized protein RHOBADRAFT_50988 [Rhodotorula graminis WP1]|uniref:Type I-E CRISPR-associated protein Cse2/CasB n=1 Tax=Rhodotorula graminis (strain WP1) TaxID=578459 RepID=A0A194SDK5_RHOGW|nr:uncharacterized protein RHOBADRAFT_50988 [Rhodotorula graminis WP1]KPV78530.1 hypothetical protein RHOBADRAFT_50988 [Rhodotorula graminis WP1]